MAMMLRTKNRIRLKSNYVSNVLTVSRTYRYREQQMFTVNLFYYIDYVALLLNSYFAIYTNYIEMV